MEKQVPFKYTMGSPGFLWNQGYRELLAFKVPQVRASQALKVSLAFKVPQVLGL
jgi:hypothetical protein